MSWTAYLHPLTMLGVLALGLLVLREGFELRRARQAGRSRATARHRQLAKLFVPLMALGYLAGLLSLGWIRGEPIFKSLHWPLATLSTVLLVGAGTLGLQLERGLALDQRSAHALFGALGVLLALFAAAAGVSLLP
jgi:hypothetical protein